ncbi:hypothetical protein DS909_08430 [Phaeobacter gallaeciensis]|uniref:Class I SAM-dependent methyltransferase n=2 Tax=Roseobacteraceae TaxID=2854170 RepID=A0A366X0G1_9RHOB|nr:MULTISPECIES: hypothetical protein [Roseobacteraceae]MBT3140037.1 hypothetical protein [Falsiruegeria litorea]MBT8167184.1 hypothetical protein [Falsiruegeria litorea]RBW57019.1 hypothetical protein DS909_08430 [Phaeobacter gallaeciensis]
MQVIEEFEADLRAFDAVYEQWKLKNPERGFSYFNTRRIANGVKAGRIHDTLGANLKGEQDWWSHGRGDFEKFLPHDLPKTAKVCEIGCGSLRVGAHFIKRQDPGCYFGLDVISAFYQIGLEIIGPLKAEKKPKFGVFENRTQMAADWAPDLVFSNAVALHVHPEDEQAHFAMLKTLAAKKGARVMMQVHVADAPFRFGRSGWARTLDQYRSLMAPFELVQISPDKTWETPLHRIEAKVLTFKAP